MIKIWRSHLNYLKLQQNIVERAIKSGDHDDWRTLKKSK